MKNWIYGLLILLPACTTTVPVKPIGDYSDQLGDCILDESDALFFAQPEYPSRLGRSGQEGWVVLLFDIKEGQPNNIKVIDSSPEGVFDQSAKVALANSKYQPDTTKKSCIHKALFKFGS